MMRARINQLRWIPLVGVLLWATACVPLEQRLELQKVLPDTYAGSKENAQVALPKWQDFFLDEHLSSLIEIATQQNQELLIALQDVLISRNQAYARSGAYLPFVDVGTMAGVDKTGRYTRLGAVEEGLDIEDGRKFPDPLQSYAFGLHATWEIDIWRKLRNLEKAAVTRYLATQEGRNLLLTATIAEVASSYYELLALDEQQRIVDQNIKVQRSALHTISLEKQGARVTELALQRFRAQLLSTQSRRYLIKQKITEVENRINLLLGRMPQPIKRSADGLNQTLTDKFKSGVPSQLLQQRPDLRRAELNLAAAELDIKAARARFYPTINLSAEVGLDAYKTQKLLTTPDSLMYSVGVGIFAPLFNRRDIEAEYRNANAEQRKAVWEYQRAVLGAFIEVSNELANIDNISHSQELKRKQVTTLEESIGVSNILYRAARADYMEVLLTQREALEAEFELIELQLKRKEAAIALFRALGGGWANAHSSLMR